MPDEGVPRHERDALEPAIGVCIVESLVLHPQRQVDIFEQAPTVSLNENTTRLAVNTPYSYGAQVHAKPPLVIARTTSSHTAQHSMCLA